MSIVDELITDRTQADVNRVRELALKGWANLTEGEKAEWNAGMKGAYNATDLNRVTQAMDYINAELEGYGYVTGYQKVKVPHEAQPVSPLPDGYVQLEYIESTRTQYIDTGFNVTANTQIDMSGYVESYSTNFALFGARSAASSTNDTANLLLFMANGTIRSDYYGNSISATATISGTFDIHRTKNVTTVNSYTLTNAESTSFSGLPLFLFAANTNGSASLFGSFRLYSCQIYDNETIVRDFIPCIDPSGEVGLYDTVDGLFYGNEGTGAFIAGPHKGFIDENTLLLIHGDSVSDESLYSVPITNGGVSVSSAQGKLGESSLYFNGSSAITISMEDIGLDFNGDWTLEWWEYTTAAASTASAIFCMPNGANGFVSYSPTSGNVRLFAGNGTWGFIAVSTIGTFIQGEWTHRAICKSGTTVYAFENGELFTTLQTSGSLTQTDTLYIGYRATTSNACYYTGYLDEIRVSNIARWTSSFSPPTERYTATTVGENTELDPYTWYIQDIPTQSQMQAYLANVQALRDVLSVEQALPESMANLTYAGANEIEQALFLTEQIIQQVVAAFPRLAASTFWSGYRPLPSAMSDLGHTWDEFDAEGFVWNDLETADWYTWAYGSKEALT